MPKIAVLFCLFCLSACTKIYRVEITKFVSEDAVFEKIAEENKKNIVFIVVNKADDVKYTGTGFVVGKSGYILTVAHLFDEGIDKKLIEIKQGDQTLAKGVEDIVINPKYDLALIKIGHQFKTAVRTKARTLRSGEPVFSMGYPFTGWKEFSRKTSLKKSYGRFYLYANEKNSKTGRDMRMQICTTKIAKGASGSPIFDVNGDVIGVISLIQYLGYSYQVYDWSVPIEHYENFLKIFQR